MKKVLCYTFTDKKLQDFIPYFFVDTINESSRIFNIIDYVKADSEQNIQDDFITRNQENYLDEIYIILKDKIRLHSFDRPLSQYTYCSFKNLCSALCQTEIGTLDVEQAIDYYIEFGAEFE